MPRKQTTHRKRITPLFRHWGDQEIATQLIRLMVLYEDLRLEYNSFFEENVGYIDDLQSRAHRRMYFLRRIYATLYEIRRGINKLDGILEFREFLERQRPGDTMNWRAGHRFFQDHQQTIVDRRNQYGGHFDDHAADFARQNLDEDTEGTVVVTQDTTEHTASVVLVFTAELVGLASTIDRPTDADVAHFVKGSYAFLNQAMKHASMAIEVVLFGLVWPHFGIERKKQLEIKDTRRLRKRLRMSN